MDILVYNFMIFLIGLIGIITIRKDLISILICSEIMFLASVINLLTFSNINDDIDGIMGVILVLTIAASETAVALSIIVVFYKLTKKTQINYIDSLMEKDEIQKKEIKKEEQR